MAAETGLQLALGDVLSAVPLAGLSNRVFRVETRKGAFVLRLPHEERDGLVDRTVEFANLHHAANLGLAPEPIYSNHLSGVLLTRALETKAWEAGVPDPAELGGALRGLHLSGNEFKGYRDPRAWVEVLVTQLDLNQATKHRISSLVTCLNDPSLADVWAGRSYVPSHWDITLSNCLSGPDGLVLIDWEFSAMGPRGWDLAYASLEIGYSNEQQIALLAAYGAGEEQVHLVREVQIMNVWCDVISTLWALGQALKGNPATDFEAFAKIRLERAETHLKALA